jgi:hypothetical protein
MALQFGVYPPELQKKSAMTLALSDHNISLVNSLRNVAQRASFDFNIVKFFADDDYAKSSLVRFKTSGNSELAALADKAVSSLLQPAVHTRHAEVLPTAAATEVRLAPKAAPAASTVRYAAAKELMNGLVVDAAGLRSLLFVLSLESSSSLADLVALLPRFEKLVSKSVGPVAAQAMTAQIRKVL